jgi:hypothetical protein
MSISPRRVIRALTGWIALCLAAYAFVLYCAAVSP